MAASDETSLRDPFSAQSNATNAPSVASLKQDATAAVGEAQDLGAKVATEAKEQVSKLAEQARVKLDEATNKVKGIAGEQKDLLADQISGVAKGADRVASDLESSNGAGAQYIRIAADNAGKLSDTIRNNNVDQILNLAQDFGRRQPLAFLGAAALLGLGTSRFLAAAAQRSSAPDRMAENPSLPTRPALPLNGAARQSAGGI